MPFYRDKAIEYLDLFHGSGKRCLVVIDGLDEAGGWQVNTRVLPFDPAPGLRIVASARQLAGDRGSTDWLRRLGWKERGVLARTMEIPLLDGDGIADVIEKMGCPLAPLSEDVDVMAELARLTVGEPLLIGCYVTQPEAAFPPWKGVALVTAPGGIDLRSANEQGHNISAMWKSPLPCYSLHAGRERPSFPEIAPIRCFAPLD